MPGKLFGRNIRLDRAFDEGYRGAPAANPHPANSPANLAYAAGATQHSSGTPYIPWAGPAPCTGLGLGATAMEAPAAEPPAAEAPAAEPPAAEAPAAEAPAAEPPAAEPPAPAPPPAIKK